MFTKYASQKPYNHDNFQSRLSQTAEKSSSLDVRELAETLKQREEPGTHDLWLFDVCTVQVGQNHITTRICRVVFPNRCLRFSITDSAQTRKGLLSRPERTVARGGTTLSISCKRRFRPPASSFVIRPLAANFCDDFLATKV